MKTVDPGGPEEGRHHGKLDQLFQWLGGYSPKNLAHESPEHCEPIAKLGGTVLFAALIALMNWAIAAFIFTEENGLIARIIAALLGGIVAVTMIFVVDRSALYFCDSMPIRRVPLALWIAMRAAIIVAIGGVTAQQALMPLILSGPLQAHALQMWEAADARRVAGLAGVYGLAEKKEVSSVASAELLRLESEAATIPANIQARFADARRCWVAYAGRKKVMIDRGQPEANVKGILSLLARQCSQKQKFAEQEKEIHDAIVRMKHQEAVAQKTVADADLRSATTAVSTRIDEARAIEKAAINPRSPTVLADLLATDRGAWVTWLICTFLLVAMELMPLISKILASKSPIGLRISTERAIDAILLDERLTQATRDAAISREVGNSIHETILVACQSPEICDTCTKLFAKKIAALVPLEIVHAFLRELERTQFDVERAIRQSPRHAPIIIEVLADAVREAGEILKSSAGVQANQARPHMDQQKAA
jgi:hypothetical protein